MRSSECSLLLPHRAKGALAIALRPKWALCDTDSAARVGVCAETVPPLVNRELVMLGYNKDPCAYERGEKRVENEVNLVCVMLLPAHTERQTVNSSSSSY